jgi:hypothetical protein
MEDLVYEAPRSGAGPVIRVFRVASVTRIVQVCLRVDHETVALDPGFEP